MTCTRRSDNCRDASASRSGFRADALGQGKAAQCAILEPFDTLSYWDLLFLMQQSGHERRSGQWRPAPVDQRSERLAQPFKPACAVPTAMAARCTASSRHIFTLVASALFFFQWRIGFVRPRLRFGAPGFAQRGFLVSLSLFLLVPSTCRPRSLGSISSVICLKCHRFSLVDHALLGLCKHVAMPSQRHVCASNYNDRDKERSM